MSYGITNEDRQYIDKKLDKQRKFLKNFVIPIGHKDIDLLENSYSANINPEKYFSEINNRVNSIVTYAKDLNLKPVFLTITAPSYLNIAHNKYAYKSLYKGGHHYCPYTKSKMFIYDNKLGPEKLNSRKTTRELSKFWARFISLQVFRRIKKETGHNMIYFRTYEPQENCTPHIHALIFIPENFIKEVEGKFNEFFKALEIKQTKFIHTWENQEYGAVAYTMKYINKTFKNAQSGVMDDCAYWCIKHRVIRFSSSRTLVPLWIYRKVRYRFKDINNDLIHITKLFRNNVIDSYFNKRVIEYKNVCQQDGQLFSEILWKKCYIENLSRDVTVTVHWDDVKQRKYYTETEKNKSYNINKKIEYVKPKFDKKTKFEVVKDFEIYVLDIKNNTLVEKIEIVSKMPDLRLIKHFRKIDKNLDGVNLHHYGLVKNEMIKRKLLEGKVISVNEYNTDFK